MKWAKVDDGGVLIEGFVCKRWVFVCSVSEFSHSLTWEIMIITI